MKVIFKRLNAFWANPKNDLVEDLKKLNALSLKIEALKNMPNKVEAIVSLFKIISPIQDEGGYDHIIKKLESKNYGQLDSVINSFKNLNLHVKNAGRNEFGMNRTKEGEEVNSSKVYLGNVHGIFTLTAEYFLKNKERLDKQLRIDLAKDPENPPSVWYVINDYQAGGFVKAHVDGILKEIEEIKKVA
jgi:hypothetical protein